MTIIARSGGFDGREPLGITGDHLSSLGTRYEAPKLPASTLYPSAFRTAFISFFRSIKRIFGEDI
jgi:hypothetical protein